MLRAAANSGSGGGGVTSVNGKTGVVLVGNTMEIAFNAVGSGLTTWTNLPAAADFFSGTYQRVIKKADLTNYTECRIVAMTATTVASAGSKLIGRYISVFSTTAANWLDLGTSEVSTLVDTINTCSASSWVPLAALAKGDNFVTVMGASGDGVADPNFGPISLQFR